MTSPKYYREQAQVLAGLALSTNDPTEADRFKLAAMEHLQRAESLEGADDGACRTLADATGAFSSSDTSLGDTVPFRTSS
jgi:hypothetical protein